MPEMVGSAFRVSPLSIISILRVAITSPTAGIAPIQYPDCIHHLDGLERLLPSRPLLDAPIENASYAAVNSMSRSGPCLSFKMCGRSHNIWSVRRVEKETASDEKGDQPS